MAASSPAFRRAGKAGLRWLYFGHRWLGVVACLFFAMWFFSGVVMMYVPYPALTGEERLARSPPIAWARVAVDPGRALTTSGATRYPDQLRLEMMGPTPVYRIRGGGRDAVISAVDGRRIGPVSEAQAAASAAAFAPGSRPMLRELLARDQWTVAGGFDRARPMYLFDMNDGRGGRLYVSRATGEVVQDTNARERFWNWVGSMPHWLYPTALRQNQPAWRQVVMWISGVATISAVTGIWIGILRLRIRKTRPEQRHSPYRGWMMVHHWAGLVGGLFLTTWIVSGWWSVNPFRWFDTPSLSSEGLALYAGQSAPRFEADLSRLAAVGPGATQAAFVWLQGKPRVVLAYPGGGEVLLDARTGARARLTDPAIFAAAGHLLPGARVMGTLRQTQDDNYWYSHHDTRPMPVLRAAYDDPARTWIYISPASGQVLDISNASSRAYRWVFAGLHQLDFRFLVLHRPAWDLALWLLAAGGSVTSVSGLVIGWRTLRGRRKRLPGSNAA